MLTKTPSWTTSDGKIHTNYVGALKHELATMFFKSGGNEPIAKAIVESLNPESIDRTIEILQLIKVELNDPSVFEVHKVEKPPISGIQDLPENKSLGVIGDRVENDTDTNTLELSDNQVVDDPEQKNLEPGPDAPPRVFTDPLFSLRARTEGERVDA